MIGIGIGIGIIFFAVLALTGKGRVLFSGFYHLFFQKVAETPEGAEAIYMKAIDKAQNSYRVASDVLQKLSGRLYTAKQNLTDTNKKVNDTKAKMEQSAQKGMMDNVMLYGQNLNLLEEKEKMYQEQIDKLTPMVQEAEQIATQTGNKYKQLQSEKDIIIEQIKLNKEQKEIYDGLDELKQNDSLDKLVASVKTGLKEGTEKAVGAKIVHNNKVETKLLKADQQLNSGEFNSYAQELMKKYGKSK